ncbi:hypothetical protein ACFWOX_35350 [Streptomyces sp. NPDC058467]|uniref:hypothetical protein n=1 Tax=unclassified Streptomyces TaxID=2593676 RepID=UPI003656DD41
MGGVAAQLAVEPVGFGGGVEEQVGQFAQRGAALMPLADEALVSVLVKLRAQGLVPRGTSWRGV